MAGTTINDYQHRYNTRLNMGLTSAATGLSFLKEVRQVANDPSVNHETLLFDVLNEMEFKLERIQRQMVVAKDWGALIEDEVRKLRRAWRDKANLANVNGLRLIAVRVREKRLEAEIARLRAKLTEKTIIVPPPYIRRTDA